MKLLKIHFVKKYRNNKKNYCLISMKNDERKHIIILGNLIRRVLLKNIL